MTFTIPQPPQEEAPAAILLVGQVLRQHLGALAAGQA